MLAYVYLNSSHATHTTGFHPLIATLPSLSSSLPRSHGLASAPQRQHQVQRRSTLELVVLGCLVI